VKTRARCAGRLKLHSGTNHTTKAESIILKPGCPRALENHVSLYRRFTIAIHGSDMHCSLFSIIHRKRDRCIPNATRALAGRY
jgi:hypothetical protein